MIPTDRRNKIVDYIRNKKTATIQELCKQFNISEITLRRDFNILVEGGIIKKVYGGATINNNIPVEASLLKRMGKNIEEKRKIASEAIKRISDGDTILLESGTTCLEVVKLFEDKKNVNVITASPHIINMVCSMKRENKFNGELLSCGGLWRGEPDDIFVGPHAISFFDHIKINISFFGIFAINLEDGWMAPSIFEAELTKKIIKCSDKIIGIADHTKFNNVSLTNIGPLNLFDEIITDNGLSKEDIKKYGNVIKITIV